MQRRQLLAASLASPLLTSSAPVSKEDAEAALESTRSRLGEPFNLLYAPHFGMFRQHGGKSLIDQLKFMYDEGFRAIEDNGMAGRGAKTQEEIGNFLRDHDMTMGVFVGHGEFNKSTFVLPHAEAHARIEKDMRKAVEVAARVGAKWFTVVPGNS